MLQSEAFEQWWTQEVNGWRAPVRDFQLARYWAEQAWEKAMSSGRIAELEEAIRYVVTQEMDDLCWMDIYNKLAKLINIDFHPAALPRGRMLRNCERFVDSILAGCPYATDQATQLVKEARELRATFELRWKADMRAVARWRVEKPGRELTLPDHADLVCYLLDRLEKTEADFAEYRRRHHPTEEIS